MLLVLFYTATSVYIFLKLEIIENFYFVLLTMTIL